MFKHENWFKMWLKKIQIWWKKMRIILASSAPEVEPYLLKLDLMDAMGYKYLLSARIIKYLDQIVEN